MWIQVRTIDGSQTRTVEDVSRKATIEELRERVWALFDVRPECQRLFYRGKQVRRPAGEAGYRAGPGARAVRSPGMRSAGLRLWGPQIQVRPAGRKARAQGPGDLAVFGSGSGHRRSLRCPWVPVFPRLGDGDRSQEGQRARGSHGGARRNELASAALTPAPGSQTRDGKRGA